MHRSTRTRRLRSLVVRAVVAAALVALGAAFVVVGLGAADGAQAQDATWTTEPRRPAGDPAAATRTLATLSLVADRKREERAAAEVAAAAATQAAAEAQAQAEAAAAAAAAQAEAERAAAAAEAARSAVREATTPDGARAAARALLVDYGWGDSQFSCLDRLWQRESGWDYTARNPSSGAFGIPQSLPASKMATVADDYRTNPITQITWGLGYIEERYGSPCSAWSHSQSVGWY